MLKESLLEIFERDLHKLKDEINSYKNEEALWTVNGEIANSAGNLCLHLLGNLNFHIGQVLGKTGYIRERDKEFSATNVTRRELNKKIIETIEVIKKSLKNLTDQDLEKIYPVDISGTPKKTGMILIHLLAHFNYHLGQINYHKRLVKNG